MSKRRLLNSSAIGSATFIAVAFSLSAPVLAQTIPEATADEQAQAQAEATLPADPEATQEGGDIVVTGSRIRRSEYNSPDPISIIDPVIGRAQGQLDTASIIQSSTIAAGSSQITTAISSNFVTNGGEGANTISLRGLGAERTLVLLNGRRAGPSGTRGAVSSFDLNVLPQSVIQSVEILKTGASSVYGSDAIAGVVNLLTKKSTKGLELNGFTSIPFEGGGEQYSLNGAWGKEFDRGHILVAADYYRQNNVQRQDREYLRCDEAYIFRPDTRDRADIVDPRTNSYRCDAVLWGHIWTYDYGGGTGNLPGTGAPYFLQFDYDGNLGQYIPGISPATNNVELIAPPGWFQVGYDQATQGVFNYYHPFVGRSTFTPSTERFTGYLSASYKITDNIEAYTELLHNRRRNKSISYYQPYQFVGYSADQIRGIDDPDELNDPFAVGFTGAVGISPTGIIDWGDTRVEVDYTRAVGGLRGDFGNFLSGWSWDGYVQYSRSDGEYSREVILDDAISAATRRTGSCVGQTLPISGKPCIDIPWTDPYFLRGEWTQAQRDFLLDTDTGNTLYTQWAGELSATGTLFKLPAGNVAVAFGVAYRRDELEDVPGEISQSGNGWNVTAAGVTAGSAVTKEAFGEIEIPLIYNTPLIQSFTITGAGRVTNNTTERTSTGESFSDNGNWTYSAKANWRVTDWLQFRGTYGTSFRSPAIFEQVVEAQTGNVDQRSVDPCINWTTNLARGGITQQIADNCAADGVPGDYTGTGLDATTITGGGLGILKAETSTAKTASVVLTPRFGFLPDTRFSLAVDYFDIEVKGEITTLPPENIVGGCYASDFFPNDPLCDLFTRNPANASIFPNNIDNVIASYINIAEQRNRGIDVTGNIRHDFGGMGSLSFLAQMTWQFEDKIGLFADTITSTNGEGGEPRWVGDFNLVYDAPGGWSLFYGLDVIGATSNEQDYLDVNGDLCGNYTDSYGQACLDLSADATFYHSASIKKTLDKFELTLGLSNIFNTKPPRISDDDLHGEVSTIGQGIFASQYDYVGRRAFINVTARF